MSFEEIKSLIDSLIQYGISPVITGIVVFLLLRIFLPGYLSEKGKNVATKEDIGEITDKVESIRAGYAELLEGTKSENQIKISAIEREKILKKEIYMEAVEAIVKAQSLIGSISNMDLAEDQIAKEFAAESGKIAKIQLVGSEETVRSITNFMGELGAVFLELALDRASLTYRKVDIDIASSARDRYQSEVDRYLAIMKSLNLDGNTDQATWDVVKKSFEFEVEQRDKHNDDLNRMWAAQSQEQISLARKCTDKYFEISHMLPKLIISVRQELDLPIDSDEYIKIYENSLSHCVEVIKSFYDKIEGMSA